MYNKLETLATKHKVSIGFVLVIVCILLAGMAAPV
jgi:hypothetical protein